MGSGGTVAASGTGADPAVDGRTARAVRTRRAVVDALLALLEEGDLKPSGERIAERAGVSLRSVWANFSDLETLYAAAGERLIQGMMARFKPVDPCLPLPQRVDAFCRQRARILEYVTPAARSAQLREPFSAQLRANRNRHYDVSRIEITTLFAVELAAAGDGAEELLDALVTAAAWPSWYVMRDHRKMSVKTARGIMRRTVAALLTAPPAA